MRAGLFTLLLACRIAFGSAAGDTAAIYPPGPGVTPPKVIHRVPPFYTAEAREAMVQGTAVLEVVVDENGAPTRISVISPIGFGLDEKAREAVSQWEFRPGHKDGMPVTTVITVPVEFRLYRRAFNPRSEERRTQYNLAVEQIQTHRRTAQTMETVRNLAEQKYPPAMYLYATMLESGDGFPPDPDLALRLIQEAAARYYPAAMFSEGRMLLAGRRIPQDPARGLELIRNAAVLHNRAAQFFLASAYEHGGLVPQNPEQARQFYRLCAQQGETVCQVRLAKLLLDKPGREERDYLQAIAWLEIASERGNPQAGLLLDPERPGLTESQADWVDRIKAQIVALR